MAIGAGIVDDDDPIVAVVHEAARRCHRAPGCRHHSLFVSAEERQSPAYAAFWKALASGEFQSGEFRRVAKGGGEVWIFGTYNPVLDAEGKPCAVVKFANDVTSEVNDRRRRAEGLRAIDADIADITKAKTEARRARKRLAQAPRCRSGNGGS